jgi:coenzyme F420-reducing hydrogenase alpha subunit
MIELAREDAQVRRVTIRSTRPMQAARVFEGKSPEAVLQLLPLLYSVCATAQVQSAQIACEQALGMTPPGGVRLARELLVCLETAREHLWRVLLDWPTFADEDSLAALAAPLTRLLPEARNALFVDGRAFGLDVKLHAADWALNDLARMLNALLERTVFGCSAQEWLTISDKARLDAWIGRSGSIAARVLRRVQDHGWEASGVVEPAFLPALPEAQLEAYLSATGADTFIAHPEWQGAPRETTPLSRQQDTPLIRSLVAHPGAGLFARLVALLVELAQAPECIREFSESLRRQGYGESNLTGTTPSGVGLAQVEAARGRLVHRVALARGSVRHYQILAPTEWNFHPAGVAARALKSLPAQDGASLRRQAAMLISAVDPCVDYELTLN